MSDFSIDEKKISGKGPLMKQLSPLTLKDFLMKNQRVTVHQIQMHFQSDPKMVSYLIDFWRISGLIKVSGDCGPCHSCPQGDPIIESHFNE